MQRLLPAVLVFVAGCASVVPHSMNERAIDIIMSDYAGDDRPGASVLVLRDGRVVFSKAYGLADVGAGTRARTDTNYRLASVTKAFTAAAILRLEEQGRLSFDDEARRFLPTLPQRVTIRQMLTHSSGLVAYEDVMPDGTERPLRDADVLSLLETQQTTYFEPGTSYRYSNSGYALLALIVEKAGGKSFSDFLRDEIFRPLGMADTVAHVEGETVVARRAYGHSRDGDSWRRTDQSLTSAVLGDGGVYASVDDLAKWLAALDRGLFAEAAQPRVATSDPAVKYGYGWRISQRNGETIVMHTGETIGFRNAVVRIPGRKMSVVVLTNRNEGTPLALAFAIADSFGD